MDEIYLQLIELGRNYCIDTERIDAAIAAVSARYAHLVRLDNRVGFTPGHFLVGTLSDLMLAWKIGVIQTEYVPQDTGDGAVVSSWRGWLGPVYRSVGANCDPVYVSDVCYLSHSTAVEAVLEYAKKYGWAIAHDAVYY